MLLTLIFSLSVPLGWPWGVGGKTKTKPTQHTWLLSEPFMEDLANLLTSLTDFKEILFACSCEPETQSKHIAKHQSQPHTLLCCVGILGPSACRRYCTVGAQPASSLGETFGALLVAEREARNYFNAEMGKKLLWDTHESLAGWPRERGAEEGQGYCSSTSTLALLAQRVKHSISKTSSSNRGDT